MENKMKKVAAYCRVSTDKDDQANSLKSQISYFDKYIRDNDEWELVETYYDEGITGTSTKKRAAFNRMINDAINGKIDLILTKEISRFARNTLDSIKFTRDLKQIGVGVLFISDNINTLDNDGELRLTIMSSIAQEESRKTSERVKWGQKRRMEQGVVFGRDMLGYNLENGQLTINQDEAEIVKLIYYKYLNENKGTLTIARELYEAGITAKRVKEWSNTMILKVLRNEKYVGDLMQKKTYTPDYLSHSKKYNCGHEDMVFIRDHHEPIIDRNIWDKVQIELQRRSILTEEQKSKHSNRYWCSGKIICGECGQRFVSRRKKLKCGAQYKAWRCTASAAHGKAKVDQLGNQVGCNSSSINDRTLLICAGKAIDYARVNKDAIIKRFIQDIKLIQSTDHSIDTTKLLDQINRINNKKMKTYDLVLEGLMNKDGLKLQIEQYDNEIQMMNEQISKAKNINNLLQTQVDSINNYIDELQKMMLPESGEELAYHRAIDKIKVYRDNIVEIYLICLPYGIRLKYTAYGKMDEYKIDVQYL
jgi:DNA invertase Pin-like site-specific DNA recombinase